MITLLPRPPNGLDQVVFREFLPTREISSSNLRINLHTGVRGDEVLYVNNTSSDLNHNTRKREYDSPGISYLFLIGIPLPTIASYFISLMDTMLSILVMPSQCKMSGMRAWLKYGLP